MNRTLLQQLAEERVRDAKVLLDSGQWSGAYYLAGYAVECALKACIAKQTQLHDFPDKDRVVKSYTHDFDALVIVAGIQADLTAVRKVDQSFLDHWLRVKDWSEKARYREWDEPAARSLFEAVTNPTNGVLRWVKQHW